MAIHAHSTAASARQYGLLRRAFAHSRGLPKSGDSVSADVALKPEDIPAPAGLVPAHDTLAAVEAEFAAFIAQPWPDQDAERGSAPGTLSLKLQGNSAPTTGLLPAAAPLPSLPSAELDALLAVQGRPTPRFRALVTAAAHGAALLDALDLPPLALDVLDVAIAALDYRDGDADLEDDDREHDTADAEEDLGWSAIHSQVHLGRNTADGDATALERHGRGFVRSGPEDAEEDDPGEEDDASGDEAEAYPWRFRRDDAVQIAARVAYV